MTNLTNDQLNQLIAESDKKRAAEKAVAVASIDQKYDMLVELIKQMKPESSETVFKGRSVAGSLSGEQATHAQPMPTRRVPKIPTGRGAISKAAQDYVKGRDGSFSIDDVAAAVKARGIIFEREAISAYLKRGVKSNTIRRIRAGTNTTPALYELVKK